MNILAGALLGGVLILGTAGLVLAADPTASPSASPSQQTPWSMMGGQGMMGSMDGEYLSDMTAMHAAMEGTMRKDGTCDPAQMQPIHDQYDSNR